VNPLLTLFGEHRRMLRLLLPAISLLALVSPAIASGKSPGAYANLPGRDANACARACADDGLCMAWTFHPNGACELTAIAPSSRSPGAAAFGMASRAPAMPNLVHAPAAPFEAVAVIADVPVLDHPAAEPIAETDQSLLLLGGPQESDLRSRLSVRQ
jgi:hypothetical protein